MAAFTVTLATLWTAFSPTRLTPIAFEPIPTALAPSLAPATSLAPVPSATLTGSTMSGLSLSNVLFFLTTTEFPAADADTSAGTSKDPSELLGTNGEAAASVSVDTADDAGRMADDRAPDGKLAATANNSSRVAVRTEQRRTDVVEIGDGAISICLRYLGNTRIYTSVWSMTAAVSTMVGHKIFCQPIVCVFRRDSALSLAFTMTASGSVSLVLHRSRRTLCDGTTTAIAPVR